jgi:hypothetical protein
MARVQPARLILCLQSTPGLSETVAHLVLRQGRIRWDRPVSGPVVVSLGGQRYTTQVCEIQRQLGRSDMQRARHADERIFEMPMAGVADTAA